MPDANGFYTREEVSSFYAGRGTARADSEKPQLRQVIRVDEFSGRRYYEYEGDKSVWMDQFKGPAQRQVMIHKDDFSKTAHVRALREFNAREAMYAEINRRLGGK